MINHIPPITDPRGRGCYQPSLDQILIDDTHALMSAYTFGELYEYSHSFPLDVYAGKMWKSHLRSGEWVLRWYYNHPRDPKRCVSELREILIV